MTFEEYNIWVIETPWPGKTPLPKKLLEEAIEYNDASLKYDWLGNEYREDILLELGDVFCLCLLNMNRYGVSPAEVMSANQEKLINRYTYGKGKMGKRS